ncbi:MAG: hypothetical protein AB7S77_08450 [Desulfatirhabdiaceae bacterium]
MEKRVYTRFTYWLDEADFLDIRNSLIQQNVAPVETRKAVCLPLANKIEIGYVAPDAWSNFETCRRQLSWYASSRYNGQYLLVSQGDIRRFGLDVTPATIITKIDFKPDRLPQPGNAKIDKLAHNARFQHDCPSEFMDIGAMGDDMQSRWLKIMGIRGITYPELFVRHCANHANFMEPDYFCDTPDGPVPYSIGKTKEVCSACLEFFNIIGGNFRKKFVVPCPGAVLFAGMSVNQYYQVETIQPS